MMAATRPVALAPGDVPADRDRPAPAAGSRDPDSRAPVIVLATAYSGAGRLRSLLAGLPDLACTTGTGILPLCEQAQAAWRNADGRPGRAPSALAISSTRALTDIIVTSILAREGKRRWCETCTAQPDVAETFLRLYPSTRFLCLYRSCGQVIRAALDASPWGMADPVLAPFIRTHPASTAAALSAYWAAYTGSLLAFERSHPQAALRLRFEDLASAEPQTAQAVTSFLGGGLLGADSPGAKLGGGATLDEDSRPGPDPGPPGAEFPVGQIPAPLLAQLNELHRDLGYPPITGAEA